MKSKGIVSLHSQVSNRATPITNENEKVLEQMKRITSNKMKRTVGNESTGSKSNRDESSDMSENIDDEERTNCNHSNYNLNYLVDEPNKPNTVSENPKVVYAASSTFILQEGVFSPGLKMAPEIIV